MEIQYFNRGTQNVEVEKVYGDGGVKWLYQSALGKFLSGLLVKAPVSVVYGAIQSLSISRLKVPGFIKNFDINMSEFVPEEGRGELDPYSSFNSFFIRGFKEGARKFVIENIEMFENDKLALAKYNLMDCELVIAIFEHAKLIEYLVERTALTGLALDKVGGWSSAFDNLYLPVLHRNG